MMMVMTTMITIHCTLPVALVVRWVKCNTFTIVVVVCVVPVFASDRLMMLLQVLSVRY